MKSVAHLTFAEMQELMNRSAAKGERCILTVVQNREGEGERERELWHAS